MSSLGPGLGPQSRSNSKFIVKKRTDVIIQLHPPPPTFQHQYKVQKTRRRTRSDVMLPPNQQPSFIPPAQMTIRTTFRMTHK